MAENSSFPHIQPFPPSAMQVLRYSWPGPEPGTRLLTARVLYHRRVAGIRHLAEAVEILERLAELGYGHLEEMPSPNPQCVRWRYVKLVMS